MGLLDSLNSDDGMLGLLLMQAGAAKPVRTGFGEGLLGALGALEQRKAGREDRDMRKQQFGLQQQQQHLALQELQRKIAQQQAEAQRNAEFQRALQGGAVTPQQALAGGGGPTQANAAQIGQQRPTDFAALAMKYPDQAELLQKLSGSRNWGRDKVARTVEVRGPNGMPMIQREDDYGGVIGQNSEKPVEMRLENMGGHSEAVNPFALTPGQRLNRTMTPDGAAANAIARANLELSKQRAAQEGAGQLIETPGGYVRVGRDNQAVPITMGGQPVMGKTAAPKDLNDAQSKALLFGTRAQEANSILGKMAASGTNRPSLIKQGVEGLPMVGGALGAAANAAIATPDQQSVEQAQRDFVNAVLRRESGAVISDQEFGNAQRQYFPQVGDGPQVIAQKARNRALATDLILREVPAQHRGAPSGQPSLDDLLKKYGG
jgi:hypothetical protein